MRKSMWMKFGLGAACGAAFALAGVQSANAQGTLGETVSMVEPAVSLVMPFDVTTGHESFQLVSRKGATENVVATHWSFWSSSCDHLGDVFICLTDNDTIVVDPKTVQSQVQGGGTNRNVGPVLNFGGSRGFVTVSQFAARSGLDGCSVDDPTVLLETPSLVGSWVIANNESNAAFGNNAIGLISPATPQDLPDTTTLFTDTSGLQLQFFNPDDLEDSEVYVIGIGSPNGNGEFAPTEIGPIPANLPNGAALCCNAEYFDNIETNISIPDLCFTCAAFSAITQTLAETDRCEGGDNSGEVCASDAECPNSSCGEHFLIPDSKAPHTSGFLSLTNCIAAGADGVVDSLTNLSAFPNLAGDDVQIFPFAFHGMAVGPFGTSVSGKYTDANSTDL